MTVGNLHVSPGDLIMVGSFDIIDSSLTHPSPHFDITFGPFLAHFSAPTHATRAVYHALLRAHADRALLGAWNPTAWSIWGADMTRPCQLQADSGGAIKIPIDIADKVAERAMNIRGKEERVFAYFKSKEFDAAKLGPMGKQISDAYDKEFPESFKS